MQSSYVAAEASCVGKFPKGGRLFEPLSIEIHDKVLIASRQVISGSNNWFYIGVKRSATVGSAYKFVSSGVTVPYAIPWFSSAPSTSDPTHQCVYARSSDLIWDDNHCNLNWYSICESVWLTTGPKTGYNDVVLHTIYIGNNMCQKCEGNCGLWVLNEIIKKAYPENLKKIMGAIWELPAK